MEYKSFEIRPSLLIMSNHQYFIGTALDRFLIQYL